LLEAMATLGVAFVEQPLPWGQDDLLAEIPRPLPVFADESFHTASDIAALIGKYDGVNIKLDKTGGFSEALRALKTAREHRLKVLCGCMLGTSLAMAPAMVIAQQADYVDLDAPLLLAKDRAEGIVYQGSTMHPFPAVLWG
jgi:L-alanine-DL-glutamate epimerase-like enolase superfamily enzyme